MSETEQADARRDRRLSRGGPEKGRIVALSEESRPEGVVALIGSVIFFGVIGWFSGGFRLLYDAVLAFVTGNGGGIDRVVASPLETISLAGAAIPVFVALVFATGLTVNALIGKAEQVNLFPGVREGYAFLTVFLTVLVEELFARWFMIGVLGHFMTGTIALYVLFLAANLIWAAGHWLNTKDKEKRHPLRLLYVFIGGVIFTALYLKYGFMTALLIHFAYDAVVLSMNKKMPWRRVNAKIGAYAAAEVAAAFVLARTVTHTELTAVKQWLSTDPQFVIAGWNGADYFVCYLFYAGLALVIFELLGLDHFNLSVSGSVQKISRARKGLWSLLPVLMVVATAIHVLILVGSYKLLGLFMHDTTHRVIVVVLIMAFTVKAVSGSAMARTFWSACVSYLLLCSLLALPLGTGFLLAGGTIVLSLPVTLMMAWDHLKLVPQNEELVDGEAAGGEVIDGATVPPQE